MIHHRVSIPSIESHNDWSALNKRITVWLIKSEWMTIRLSRKTGWQDAHNPKEPMRGRCTCTSRTLVYMAFTITPHHGRFRYTHDLRVKRYARVDEEQRKIGVYTRTYTICFKIGYAVFVECTFGRLSDERHKHNVYDATTTIKVTRWREKKTKMRALKCERSVSQIVFVRMTMRSREDRMLKVMDASREWCIRGIKLGKDWAYSWLFPSVCIQRRHSCLSLMSFFRSTKFMRKTDEKLTAIKIHHWCSRTGSILTNPYITWCTCLDFIHSLMKLETPFVKLIADSNTLHWSKVAT